MRGVVAIEGLDGELAAVAQLGVDLRKLVLRQGENHGDRLQLRDDEKTVLVGGVHDIADIDETQTDAAADGSSDAA